MEVGQGLRTALHARMVKDPQRAVQRVFGITRHSHIITVQRVFGACASQTGSMLSLPNKIDEFKNQGLVPDWVLQCCSADAAKNSIDF